MRAGFRRHTLSGMARWPAAGWYADPDDAPVERWFDGDDWTEHTREWRRDPWRSLRIVAWIVVGWAVLFAITVAMHKGGMF